MPEPCASDSPRWLTPEQVASRLGISVEVLDTWRQGGQGPPWVQIGPEARYDDIDVVLWRVKISGSAAGLNAVNAHLGRPRPVCFFGLLTVRLGHSFPSFTAHGMSCT